MLGTEEGDGIPAASRGMAEEGAGVRGFLRLIRKENGCEDGGRGIGTAKCSLDGIAAWLCGRDPRVDAGTLPPLALVTTIAGCLSSLSDPAVDVDGAMVPETTFDSTASGWGARLRLLAAVPILFSKRI